MSLKNALTEIVTHLSNWEKQGINEAQTRQVIILRILQQLGFNIWQPFEVIAEENSSSNNYRPDFVIKLQQDCFVIEAKALGKTLSDSDVEQAINYVNSKGLRWAILTNGKEWKFFDNDLRGAASQRFALGFTIRQLETESAVKYFEQLLSPKVWQQSHAAELVADAIHLIKLQKKLDDQIPNVYSSTPAGLQKAIQNELPSDEQDFALQHFAQIAEFFMIDISAISTPKVEFTPLITHQAVESDILQRLYAKLEQINTQDHHKTTHPVTVSIGGKTTLVTNWRQLHITIAELIIDLHGKISASPLQSEQNLNNLAYYSQLSNGEWLLTNLSAEGHLKKIKTLLNALSVPSQTLSISYKKSIYLLPEPDGRT
ncbi:MAG: type I restriction enzyme HsdR N-terminal domain-containing protein [Thiotrichaceae bacterium]